MFWIVPNSWFAALTETKIVVDLIALNKSIKFAVLLPIGIVSVIIFSILYKTSVISGIVRAFIDVINVFIMSIGLIFTVRIFILKKLKK